jgi:hypothetical protein
LKKANKTQKNPIKPNKTQKNQKTQKNHRAGFLKKKKPGFLPTLYICAIEVFQIKSSKQFKDFFLYPACRGPITV